MFSDWVNPYDNDWNGLGVSRTDHRMANYDGTRWNRFICDVPVASKSILCMEISSVECFGYNLSNFIQKLNINIQYSCTGFMYTLQIKA